MWTNSPTVPKVPNAGLPLHQPTWGASETSKANVQEDNVIKATWLGHACFLVEMPQRNLLTSGQEGSAPSRGARILFDPVFSDRCSPSQLVGPKRYTRASLCCICDVILVLRMST